MAAVSLFWDTNWRPWRHVKTYNGSPKSGNFSDVCMVGGGELVPPPPPYKRLQNFATFPGYILVTLQQVSLKLGVFQYYFRLSFQVVSTNFHQLIHVRSWKTVEGSFKCWPRFSRKKYGVFSFFLAGYNFYGTERMYSGTDGREFEADIFFGIVYYQRLRHMVADKYQVPTPPLPSFPPLSSPILVWVLHHAMDDDVMFCVSFVWLRLSHVVYSACFYRMSVTDTSGVIRYS